MKDFRVIAALATSLLVFSSISNAEFITFHFEGDLLGIYNPYQQDIGCSVSLPGRFDGCYSFDTDAIDQQPVLPRTGVYAIETYVVNFGDCRFEKEPQFRAVISVQDEEDHNGDYLPDSDDYETHVEGSTSTHPYVSFWSASTNVRAGSPSDLLSSDALPLLPPDLELATSQHDFQWRTDSRLRIYGVIDSLDILNDTCGYTPVTPPGEDIVVQPPVLDGNGDPIEDAPDVSFAFEDVVTGGETTVVITEPGGGTTSAPSGFRVTGLQGAPVLFDIETTAVLADGSNFEICFDYSGMNVAGSPDNVTLAHEVDGVWVDITYDNNTTDFIICGTADSFSYFAILESLEIIGPTDPLALETEAVLGIDVGDPDLTDAVLWQWGDSLTTEVVATTSDIVTAHTYAEAGVYTVTATLLLAGVEAGSADFQYIVVYDPTAGFVTGGGWFNSPAGAYLPDHGLVGKSTFGFVSKYKKGAIIPSGTTEFQFKAGYMNFRSVEYQWLVIAGARAQFKGIGTINGAGNFGFMLTAVDEALTPSTDVDLFRIKIWDRDDDAVIYDNGLGDADDSDPATVIDGGSIVIHKPKK